MMLRMTTSTGAQADETGWIATDDSFGARLALVRQRMGWNIAQAARECGLGTENWRLWEQAGRTPSRLTTIAMAIATKTGCDFLWLVHGPDRGARTAPSGRYGRTRVLARKAPDVRPTPIEPIGQPRVALSHIRPVRQVPPNGGRSVRPVAAAVL
jgi:transcriptional regulator with XRE-family HTH domain